MKWAAAVATTVSLVKAEQSADIPHHSGTPTRIWRAGLAPQRDLAEHKMRRCQCLCIYDSTGIISMIVVSEMDRGLVFLFRKSFAHNPTAFRSAVETKLINENCHPTSFPFFETHLLGVSRYHSPTLVVILSRPEIALHPKAFPSPPTAFPLPPFPHPLPAHDSGMTSATTCLFSLI